MMTFRKSMIFRYAPICSAIPISSFTRRVSASPAISNRRSTAKGKTSSEQNSANFLPLVILWIRSAAWRMSSRSLETSCRIKRFSLLVHDLKEIRVANRAGNDQIDFSLKQTAQVFEQTEKGVEM